LLCAGFGALLLLIALSAAVLNNRIEKVYSRVAVIQEVNRETRDNLDGLRSELYLGAIFVRDYLLESSTATAANERRILEELRKSMHQHLAELERTGGLQNLSVPESLRQAAEGYWKSIDTVFDWTPEEKAARSSTYLRKSLVPYRDAVLTAASEVAELSASETLRRQQEVLKTEHVRQLQRSKVEDSYELLTEREREVLQLLAEGHSNKEVAALLEVSPYTVETHRMHLMQKLNLHNTAEIVLYAVRKKVIS